MPLREGRTLHHDSAVITAPARWCSARRLRERGVIAGGPSRAVCEMLGIQDVVAKSLGSTNPYNMVRASFDALMRQENPAPLRPPRQEGERHRRPPP